MKTLRFRRILGLRPALLDIIQLIIKPFFIAVFIYLLLFTFRFKFYSNYEIKKDLMAIESSIEILLQQQQETMEYIGKTILNRNLENNPKDLSTFLNEAQNILMYFEKTHALKNTSLIWITPQLKSYGSFGEPDPRAYRIDGAFVKICNEQSGKIQLSNPYFNPYFPGIEHIDMGLSITNSQGVTQSTLIMHFNIEDFLNLIVKNLGAYNILMANESTAITLEGARINVDKNTIRKLVNKLEWSNSKGVNIHEDKNGNSFLYHRIGNSNYLLILNQKIPFYKWEAFLLKPLKQIPVLFLIFFLVTYLFNWYKRVFDSKVFKMLNMIKRSCGTKEFCQIKNKNNFKFSVLSYFKIILFASRKNTQALNSIRDKVFKQEADLQGALQIVAQQKETLTKNEKLISSIKHYRAENNKFRKQITSYLRANILEIITKTEVLVKEQESLTDISLSGDQRKVLIKEMNTSLKDMFNFSFSSPKSLIDPIEAMSEALASVMIYAVLRNVEIKTHFKNKLDKIWVDKLRLQLIVIGVVFKSIDTSPIDGEIFVICEKKKLKNQIYLKITIEDNAYDFYQENASTSFFDFEHISLENIRNLIEQEKGLFDLKHQLNKGKMISILIPYCLEKEKVETEKVDNVYSLF